MERSRPSPPPLSFLLSNISAFYCLVPYPNSCPLVCGCEVWGVPALGVCVKHTHCKHETQRHAEPSSFSCGMKKSHCLTPRWVKQYSGLPPPTWLFAVDVFWMKCARCTSPRQLCYQFLCLLTAVVTVWTFNNRLWLCAQSWRRVPDNRWYLEGNALHRPVLLIQISQAAQSSSKNIQTTVAWRVWAVLQAATGQVFPLLFFHFAIQNTPKTPSPRVWINERANKSPSWGPAAFHVEHSCHSPGLGTHALLISVLVLYRHSFTAYINFANWL